jgi:hypothetical protein
LSKFNFKACNSTTNTEGTFLDEHVSFHAEFSAEGVPEDPVRLICFSVAPAQEDGSVIWNSSWVVAAVIVVDVVGVCLEEAATVSSC